MKRTVRAPRLAAAELERAATVHRRQLWRAVTALLAGAAFLVGLPLLLDLVPALDDVRLLDVPVSWLAVAGAAVAGARRPGVVAAACAPEDAGTEVGTRRAGPSGGDAPVIALAVVPVLLATLLIGARGVAAMRTDVGLPRRLPPRSPRVRTPRRSSGEYLSAASFLGIAGLVVKGGVGALWYPVGFTAGYLLHAAPSSPRRCGAPARSPSPTSPRPGSARRCCAGCARSSCS